MKSALISQTVTLWLWQPYWSLPGDLPPQSSRPEPPCTLDKRRRRLSITLAGRQAQQPLQQTLSGDRGSCSSRTVAAVHHHAVSSLVATQMIMKQPIMTNSSVPHFCFSTLYYWDPGEFAHLGGKLSSTLDLKWPLSLRFGCKCSPEKDLDLPTLPETGTRLLCHVQADLPAPAPD